MLSNSRVAEMLVDHAPKGVTIDRYEGLAILSDGYVVGGETQALKTEDTLPRWMNVLLTALWLEKLPISQRLVGSWVDGDTLYVDAVRVEHDIDRAMELAYERRERAIYDVRNNRSLYVTMKETP